MSGRARERLRAGAPARPPRRGRSRRWASACSTTRRSPPRRRGAPGAERVLIARLGRAPRQRHAGHLRGARRRALHVRRTSTRSTRAPARRDEIGGGAGAGATVNCPLPRRPGRRRLRRRVSRSVPARGARLRARPGDRLGRLRRARARSAGRHAGHRARLRGDGTSLAELAAETCGGKLVLLLEGGYDLAALAASVRASPGGADRARREDFPPRRRHDAVAGASPTTRDALRRRAAPCPRLT